MKIGAGIFLLVPLFILAGCKDREALINSPQPGDVYIFEEAAIYYPVMVDSVSNQQIFCVNSHYSFTEAIPKLKDLPEDEFDFNFQLIYEKSEIQKLFQEGQIVEVYRR